MQERLRRVVALIMVIALMPVVEVGIVGETSRPASFHSYSFYDQTLMLPLGTFFGFRDAFGRAAARVIAKGAKRVLSERIYLKTRDVIRLLGNREYRRLTGQKKLHDILQFLHSEGWRESADVHDLSFRLEHDQSFLELVDILGSHTLVRPIPYVGQIGNWALVTYIATGRYWLIPLIFTTAAIRTWITIRLTRFRYPIVLAIGAIPVIGNFSAVVQMWLHHRKWAEAIFEAVLLKLAIRWTPRSARSSRLKRAARWMVLFALSLMLPAALLTVAITAFKKSVIFRLMTLLVTIATIARRFRNRFYLPGRTTTFLRNGDPIPGMSDLVDLRDTPVIAPNGCWTLALVYANGGHRVLALDRDPATGRLSNGRFLAIIGARISLQVDVLTTPNVGSDGESLWIAYEDALGGRGIAHVPFTPEQSRVGIDEMNSVWREGHPIPGMPGEHFSVVGSPTPIPGRSEVWVLNRMASEKLSVLAIPLDGLQSHIEGPVRRVLSSDESVNGKPFALWLPAYGGVSITSDGAWAAVLACDHEGRTGVLLTRPVKDRSGLQRNGHGLQGARWVAMEGRSYLGDTGLAQPLHNPRWTPSFVPDNYDFLVISVQGGRYEKKGEAPALFPTEQVLRFRFGRPSLFEMGRGYLGKRNAPPPSTPLVEHVLVAAAG